VTAATSWANVVDPSRNSCPVSTASRFTAMDNAGFELAVGGARESSWAIEHAGAAEVEPPPPRPSTPPNKEYREEGGFPQGPLMC
jgi:hypothetical protein